MEKAEAERGAERMWKHKNVILEVVGVTKKFPGVVALKNVDLVANSGEVHAIVGENGAGKTTLCNIVTGIFPPDEGEIVMQGERVTFTHPSDALGKGIRMVYQERNLVPFLTGEENILLGEEPSFGIGFIDRNQLHRRAQRLCEDLDVNIPLNITVSEMSAAQRQMIEILRALLYKPALLILDEPTSSLTEADVEILFRTIHRIKNDGIAVIFVSHSMDEVFTISDVISVFRNGERIVTKKRGEMDRDECVRHMVNRDLSRMFPPVKQSAGGTLLQIEHASDFSFLHDINLTMKQGEVVGLYGLVGSGRTELAELIYGLRFKKEGRILFEGEEIVPNIEGNIKRKLFLVPEDRHDKGLFFNINLKMNLDISFIDRFAKLFGIIRHREETSLAKKIADYKNLKVKYTSLNQNIDNLSGGNQQKVVIVRWISHEEVKCLILDEPTQGIDVGAKYEVYTIIRHLAEDRGSGVLFISSELQELIGICDRIYVIKNGTISGEVEREEFDSEKILGLALN